VQVDLEYNDGRKHSRRHFLNVQPGWDLVRKGGRKKSLKSSCLFNHSGFSFRAPKSFERR
jgi:hypothetical protein